MRLITRVYGGISPVFETFYSHPSPGHLEAVTIIAGAQFCISREEFVLIFDGLTIWQKLSTLTSMKDLPVNSHAEIVKKAQESTTRHSG